MWQLCFPIVEEERVTGNRVHQYRFCFVERLVRVYIRGQK